VPAFALVKILSNFFFARDNTKTPFYISNVMVIINISISVSLFSNFGFIIIPIATSIATWVGVLFYVYLLNQKKSLLLNDLLIPNFVKILVSTTIMSFILVLALNNYASYLDYAYKFKAIYLLLIVGFAGIIYLLSCFLLGILKIKNYKIN
jgi:putative peptidoglycan lipid II flippase